VDDDSAGIEPEHAGHQAWEGSTMKAAISFVMVAVLAAGCSGSGNGGGNGGGGNGGAGNGGGQATPGSTAASGTWTGTISRQLTVVRNGPGTHATETYQATVNVVGSSGGDGAWDLVGVGTVQASYTSDVVTDADSPLGHCHTHYTDTVPAAQISGAATGGLSVDVVFDLYMDTKDGELPQTSVRDDSGCFGSNQTYHDPWPVASMHLSASGPVTDPNHITGSQRDPDGGTTSWDLTLAP
jgi:hypothetical protein